MLGAPLVGDNKRWILLIDHAHPKPNHAAPPMVSNASKTVSFTLCTLADSILRGVLDVCIIHGFYSELESDYSKFKNA
jgi:hypothetical protein